METPLLDVPLAGLDEALQVVGDRWTLLLVAALLAGPARFGDLERALPGIAANVLTARLKALEARGLVVARPYSRRPARFAYELTDAAGELAGALRLLAGWGARHGDEADPPRHAACDTPLEVRFWCPHCEEPVEPGEATDVGHA
jgi:DNA-binding HxlR family transcriptional regulator